MVDQTSDYERSIMPKVFVHTKYLYASHKSTSQLFLLTLNDLAPFM